VLTKRCYIPHASKQLAQESTINQVKTVILQQRLQVLFCKITDEMNHVLAVTAETKASSLIKLKIIAKIETPAI